MSDELLVVKSKKVQFVQAEFELLKDWAKILEGFCKGTTLVYLQLQTGINRDETNPRFGKSWLSVANIAERCNLSPPTVHKILGFLEENEFLSRSSGAEVGKNNVYEIFPLPSYSEKKKHFLKEIEKAEESRKVSRPVMEEIFGGGKDLKDSFIRRASDDMEILAEKKEWHCNDMIKYFKAEYCLFFKGVRSKDTSTAVERSMLKRMIDEYSWETTRDAIKFGIEHWSQFGKDYPTIKGIFTYRESIVPEALNGSNKGVGRGQHKNSNKGKGAVSW